VLEGNVDGGAGSLKACAARIGLPERPRDLVAVLVEHHDIRRERIRGVEGPGPERTLLVALARQAVPRLEDVHLELLGIPVERAASREAESRGKSRDRVARRNDDVLAVPGTVEDLFTGTLGIPDSRSERWELRDRQHGH